VSGVAPHFWGAEYLGTGCLGNARNQRHRSTLVKNGFWVEPARVMGGLMGCHLPILECGLLALEKLALQL
jgi:hypothetical protein